MPIFRVKSVKIYTGQKKIYKGIPVAPVTNIRYEDQYQSLKYFIKIFLQSLPSLEYLACWSRANRVPLLHCHYKISYDLFQSLKYFHQNIFIDFTYFWNISSKYSNIGSGGLHEQIVPLSSTATTKYLMICSNF